MTMFYIDKAIPGTLGSDSSRDKIFDQLFEIIIAKQF